MTPPVSVSDVPPRVAGTNVVGTAHRLPYIQAIDGLRALAVLAVVLNHIDFPGMQRGFIGVDIFFAISGYLITRQIATRLDAGSPQQLIEFWAGRARRIVPAMVLVIALTCLGSVVFLAPQELERIGFYALASDLFGMNVAAALRGGNYFDGMLRESPFLQLWSLGVEEQFYLLWPLILGPVAVVGARVLRWSRRRVLAVGLGALGLASLMLSVALTTTAPLWAFYGLPTRLYEFALGGAAALFWRARVEGRTEWLLTWGGLGAIAAALVWTPVDVGFPGAWPLLAAGGTVALLVGVTHGSGSRTGSAAALLCVAPLRRIGRYSYSWYLWHWPALVLGLAATNNNTTFARIACVVSIVPAAASFHLLEEPLRRSPKLIGSPRRSLVMGATALGFGALCAVGVVAWGRIGVSDPQVAEWVRAEESFGADGCQGDRKLLGTEVCLGGSEQPNAPLVLLVGDSHSAQWISAFSAAGKRDGFAVALRSLGNCPAAPLTDGAHYNPDDEDERNCARYQADTARLIADANVDALVTTDAETSRRLLGTAEEWLGSAEGLVDLAGQNGLPVGLLVDNPVSRDPLRCRSRGFSTDECTLSRAEAFRYVERYAVAERRLVDQHDVRRLDLSDQICSDDPCPLQVDGEWVAARGDHLNRAFTQLQSERIGAWVDGLLAGP